MPFFQYSIYMHLDKNYNDNNMIFFHLLLALGEKWKMQLLKTQFSSHEPDLISSFDERADETAVLALCPPMSFDRFFSSGSPLS